MKLDYPTMFKNFSELLDMDLNMDTVPEDLLEVLRRYEIGEITDEEMIWGFQNIKASIDPRDVIDAWNSLLAGVNPEHFTFINELRNDYKLFLLSNINGFHERWIDRYMKREHNVEDFKVDFFDGYFYSHYIKMRKPDPVIYDFVAEKLHEQGVETWLFVDDMEVNVNGAIEKGWNAVVHHPEDDIAEKLDTYLKQEIKT